MTGDEFLEENQVNLEVFSSYTKIVWPGILLLINSSWGTVYYTKGPHVKIDRI